MAEVSFAIKYRPGHSNRDADALFRMPMDIASYMETCTEVTSHDDVIAGCVEVGAQERGDAIWVSAVRHDVNLLNLDEEYSDSAIGAISRAELFNAQEHDPVIVRVLNSKKKGTWPLQWETKNELPATRIFMRQRHKLNQGKDSYTGKLGHFHS